MQIILNNASMIPIYEQLVEQVKNLILSGELPENEALPSVRTLAAALKISALTVKKAYDKLEEDFTRALDKARAVGMTPSEIRELLGLLLEE